MFEYVQNGGKPPSRGASIGHKLIKSIHLNGFFGNLIQKTAPAIKTETNIATIGTIDPAMSCDIECLSSFKEEINTGISIAKLNRYMGPSE